MWQCDNCGYTDEDGTTFEEETEESLEDTVRYCPECGSDEVFLMDEEEELHPLDDDEDLESEEESDEDEDDEDLEDWEDEAEEEAEADEKW